MTRLNPKYIPLLATAAVLILVFGTGSLLYPNFGTPRVIVNLLGDNAFVGVAAVGESFVILGGGIDLSVGRWWLLSASSLPSFCRMDVTRSWPWESPFLLDSSPELSWAF